MLDSVFAVFLFLLPLVSTAATTFTHHYKKECADCQVPEDVCQCRVHKSPRFVINDDTHGCHR